MFQRHLHQRKKRCDINDDIIEEMDLDNISNNSLPLENMDVEVQKNDEDTPEKLSARMDEKVIEKQNWNDEDDRKRKESRGKFVLHKTNEKKVKIVKQRKERKLRKQKSKNEKKKVNNVKKHILPEKSQVPNIKDVPVGCRDLVDAGDVVYVVPGDGACYPNCAAAFFFQDEVFGPKLRKRMNEFFVKHWKRKYQNKSTCSISSPFTRKTKDGEVSFTDPVELFKYLLNPDG